MHQFYVGKRVCLGVPWWSVWYSEPLGFVQDVRDVIVLFDEWLGVLALWSVRLLDDPSTG